ncbi:YbdD/YjiX family protein [Rhizorhabdus sp. FW153]|uniref:YbdD/YjiX family protein n=1 Tax=Rhizorhabdus sp. FW153 TaxID=3400216 RepID=UPI003CEF7D78
MGALFDLLARTARMMVGMPDYGVYLRHMAEHHPDQQPMDRTAFFRNRQDARYRGGGGRCC